MSSSKPPGVSPAAPSPKPPPPPDHGQQGAGTDWHLLLAVVSLVVGLAGLIIAILQ